MYVLNYTSHSCAMPVFSQNRNHPVHSLNFFMSHKYLHVFSSVLLTYSVVKRAKG